MVGAGFKPALSCLSMVIYPLSRRGREPAPYPDTGARVRVWSLRHTMRPPVIPANAGIHNFLTREADYF